MTALNPKYVSDVFKVKNPEQLTASKLLSEVSELRSKQIQGPPLQQKSAMLPNSNHHPFHEEPGHDDYMDNRYKIDHVQRPPIHPVDFAPLSADEIGHRYLKSSEDSNVYRSNQKYEMYKPPVGPRMNYPGGDDTISSRRQFVDQVSQLIVLLQTQPLTYSKGPHASYMSGFDYMRPVENPFRVYSSPTSNVKQSFVMNSLMGLQHAQKERLLINQPPFISSGPNSVYQTPSQRWEEDTGSRAFNLKQSRSDIKLPRENPDFEGYDRFQLPVSEQYQRPPITSQPRGLSMHSNIAPKYNPAVYKTPSIVGEYSVKFPMEIVRQNRNPSSFTGTNPIPTFDESSVYSNSRPMGMNPSVYGGNREYSADLYAGPRRDLSAFEPNYKFSRNPSDMQAQRNLTEYNQMGGMNSEDRNQVPRFPKEIFNAGVKKKPIN